MAVLTRELAALYSAFSSGRSSPLPDLSIQYTDFAAWQRTVDDQVRAEQREYWTRRLAGADPMLPLPYDRPRPAAPPSLAEPLDSGKAIYDDISVDAAHWANKPCLPPGLRPVTSVRKPIGPRAAG